MSIRDLRIALRARFAYNFLRGSPALPHLHNTWKDKVKAHGSLVILAPLLLVTSCETPPADVGVPPVSEEPRTVERSEEAARAGVPRISLEDFVSLLERPEESNVIVIDVRSRENFLRGHIPGAVSIPLNNLGKRVLEISRDATIVTYCT